MKLPTSKQVSLLDNVTTHQLSIHTDEKGWQLRDIEVRTDILRNINKDIQTHRK